MLEAMRKGSQNIFVKLLLGVLALSFVVWGVGDVFRGRSSSTVATVGDFEISYNEYYNNFQRELAYFQNVIGAVLSQEQIEQFDIKGRTLQQLVDKKLMSIRSNELNVQVGGDVVKNVMINEPSFLDESGKFSAENFKKVIRYSGLTEKQYLSQVKDSVQVGILLDTIAIAPSSMTTKAKALYRYRNEYRISDVLYLPLDYIKEVAEPSETDLVQYYQDNTDNFAVPESRKVTYVKYGFEDVKNGIEISEDALKAEYDDNIQLYTEPEKRDVVQLLFNSEEDAKKALEEIKAGKESVYSDKMISLGLVTYDNLPNEIKEPVFEMEVGKFSGPVSTDLGWHILKVNNIVKPMARPFDEVRDEIADYMKDNKASDIFFDAANNIEDEIAGGATIESLAEKFDLVVHSVPSINSNAQGASGKELKEIPDPNSFVNVAFSTEAGEVSPMTLLSDNATYLLLRVEEVFPKRVKALDEVRGTAISLWKNQEKGKMLQKLAQEVALKLKEGEDIKSLSKTMGIKLKEGLEIKRPSKQAIMNNDGVVPNQLSEELFSLKIGESTSYYMTGKGEYAIGKLNQIRDAQFDDNRLISLEDSLKRDFTDDILVQYNNFLRSQYPVEQNQTLLNTSSL